MDTYDEFSVEEGASEAFSAEVDSESSFFRMLILYYTQIKSSINASSHTKIDSVYV